MCFSALPIRFIGATKLAHCEVGSKVIKKPRPMNAWALCALKTGILQSLNTMSLRMKCAMRKTKKGEPAYNFGVILNYLFRVDALDGIMEKIPSAACC